MCRNVIPSGKDLPRTPFVPVAAPKDGNQETQARDEDDEKRLQARVTSKFEKLAERPSEDAPNVIPTGGQLPRTPAVPEEALPTTATAAAAATVAAKAQELAPFKMPKGKYVISGEKVPSKPEEEQEEEPERKRKRSDSDERKPKLVLDVPHVPVNSSKHPDQPEKPPTKQQEEKGKANSAGNRQPFVVEVGKEAAVGDEVSLLSDPPASVLPSLTKHRARTPQRRPPTRRRDPNKEAQEEEGGSMPAGHDLPERASSRDALLSSLTKNRAPTPKRRPPSRQSRKDAAAAENRSDYKSGSSAKAEEGKEEGQPKPLRCLTKNRAQTPSRRPPTRNRRAKVALEEEKGEDSAKERVWEEEEGGQLRLSTSEAEEESETNENLKKDDTFDEVAQRSEATLKSLTKERPRSPKKRLPQKAKRKGKDDKVLLEQSNSGPVNVVGPEKADSVQETDKSGILDALFEKKDEAEEPPEGKKKKFRLAKKKKKEENGKGNLSPGMSPRKQEIAELLERSREATKDLEEEEAKEATRKRRGRGKRKSSSPEKKPRPEGEGKSGGAIGGGGFVGSLSDPAPSVRGSGRGAKNTTTAGTEKKTTTRKRKVLKPELEDRGVKLEEAHVSPSKRGKRSAKEKEEPEQGRSDKAEPLLPDIQAATGKRGKRSAKKKQDAGVKESEKAEPVVEIQGSPGKRGKGSAKKQQDAEVKESEKAEPVVEIQGSTGKRGMRSAKKQDAEVEESEKAEPVVEGQGSTGKRGKRSAKKQQDAEVEESEKKAEPVGEVQGSTGKRGKRSAKKKQDAEPEESRKAHLLVDTKGSTDKKIKRSSKQLDAEMEQGEKAEPVRELQGSAVKRTKRLAKKQQDVNIEGNEKTQPESKIQSSTGKRARRSAKKYVRVEESEARPETRASTGYRSRKQQHAFEVEGEKTDPVAELQGSTGKRGKRLAKKRETEPQGSDKVEPELEVQVPPITRGKRSAKKRDVKSDKREKPGDKAKSAPDEVASAEQPFATKFRGKRGRARKLSTEAAEPAALEGGGRKKHELSKGKSEEAAESSAVPPKQGKDQNESFSEEILDVEKDGGSSSAPPKARTKHQTRSNKKAAAADDTLVEKDMEEMVGKTHFKFSFCERRWGSFEFFCLFFFFFFPVHPGDCEHEVAGRRVPHSEGADGGRGGCDGRGQGATERAHQGRGVRVTGLGRFRRQEGGGVLVAAFVLRGARTLQEFFFPGLRAEHGEGRRVRHAG